MASNAAQGMRLTCPNCQQAFSAIVESIVDAGRDPNAKARFLSRRTNVVQCPSCGSVVQLSVPLVYHDHTKELMLVYFPLELNIPKPERERIIGEMTRAVMSSLPQEERKGYLFNPIEALTLDGMIDLILQKDGVTPQMIADQKAKLQLVESLLTATEAQLPALVQQHDAAIDEEFFQLMLLAIDAAPPINAEDLLNRRDQILAQSSFGKVAMERLHNQERVIAEVTQKLQKMGQQLKIDEFVDYVVEVGDSDDHLQALVGLARGVFEYQFFTYYTQRMDKSDTATKAKMEQIRDRLLELIDAIDQQQQMAVQQAQQIVQALLNAPNQAQAVEENLEYINEMVLAVIQHSLQALEERGDLLNVSRLKQLHQTIMQKLEARTPPEIRFINDLLRSEDPLEAKLMLSDRAGEFGQSLVDYMDMILENMEGQETGLLFDQLTELRHAAAKILGLEA